VNEIRIAGKRYARITCQACLKLSFLYPLDPDVGRGFCENPKCGHAEGFQIGGEKNARKKTGQAIFADRPPRD
jgi:hypothetical protein